MGSLITHAGLQEGRPWPLGAHWDGEGVNFAVFSAHAERIELCIFEEGNTTTLPLPRCTDQIWHGYLPGAKPGLCYAFRAYGPDTDGHRFDPQRLLVDPYSRDLAGRFDPDRFVPPEQQLKSRVVHEPFDWGNDAPPATPWCDTVLYEIHVKGATQAHPDVLPEQRGTYAGLTSPPMLAHLRRLGVTAVKLLPVHAFLDEKRLLHSGLKNYWGYNTLAFFAPEPRYATADSPSVINEFRTMVRALHAEGIEVILDVVFNHTAETDEFGPTLSFRGLDNASYYRLRHDNPRLYENHSGCGNTFNLAHPRVLQLVMDALRYWVGEMHVDGFRFDLAAALTRDSAFLATIAQDPLLSRVKLIAEPWDLGPDGYRLGRFPPGWSEWNDRFRDDIRAFWLTGESGIGALAQRISGSSEIFRHHGRSPTAGVNFITAHDGFTLRDLVSYKHKHNHANGENNRDGHGHNISCNCGVEGETDNPAVLERRMRLQRALLATLFVSQGIPMLQGGDEIGRTQSGNNNAYCQDNALTWLDWERADESLAEFCAGLIRLRQRFAQLRRRDWLTGQPDRHGQRDVVWWHLDGREMRGDDWNAPHAETLGAILSPPAPGGETLLILFNRTARPHTAMLPAGDWKLCCDTGTDQPFASDARRSHTTLAACSVQLLSQG
ncbi:glycogen debranching protein GlgX [Propionivibrio sp.]|jgi:glycogen debranching enzyme GlgX|uniref:glycogen debranching protein GlgX n=1 Tax=Propionivibrio sp. TaxID=2212460 RepID=UPI00272E9F65|nr:glycogen debranching protein GlgX [Propionivibrio sp.]